MSPVIFFQRHPFPTVIRGLRTAVFWVTVAYATWYEFFAANHTQVSPDALLLSPKIDFTLLWRPWTAALLIPYQGFSWSMIFDLLLVNFFLCPIYSFVLSFLTSRNFFRFLFMLVSVATLSFLACSLCVLDNTLPTSLFGSISFGVVIFWALLHSKGQSSFLVVVPIQPFWAVITAASVIMVPAMLIGDWTKCIVTCTTGICAYIFAVCRWRLKSHSPLLLAVEEWLSEIYRMIVRTYEWRIARPIRQLVRKIQLRSMV
jgi:hypothetical protein